ncbi:outer spore coat protein CotE [Longirhabdus pacifica]|uniref:outer spore coat protein CotE n=1 Tax=Longirhabdus pacifica TaxID=2305227 RepID=UPI001008A2B1|nr:outer spore coat protein CotE [Longirhabdus pacifica]
MSSANRDFQYREIITKGVIGKGRKFSQMNHVVTPNHKPTSMLGCWIINHEYEALLSENNHVEVVGTFDVNVWYSYDKNTKTEVVNEIVSYVDIVKLQFLDPNYRGNTLEVSADATQQPSCVEANIAQNGKDITLKVEREFKVEMVAETKLTVLVTENGDDDKFIGLMDEVDGANDDLEFEDLDPEFLDDDFDDELN